MMFRRTGLFLLIGVPLLFLILLVFAWLTGAKADDLPCPPKYYFCWQAKIVFNKYGTGRVVSKARACGWTREEIGEVLKCRG
jgi:hypothetical protein